jgi:hypothetical protein
VGKTRSRASGARRDASGRAANAILQNADGYEQVATDAFQEIVADLYDGFLSAEDRRGVLPPDRGVIPPLVKWGNPQSGPYTWPVDATGQILGLQTGVVNLPPANVRMGLFAWAALGHETAGHDILHADTGLADELARAVWDALIKQKMTGLARYWSDRIDETASDVLLGTPLVCAPELEMAPRLGALLEWAAHGVAAPRGHHPSRHPPCCLQPPGIVLEQGAPGRGRPLGLEGELLGDPQRIPQEALPCP